MKGVVIMNNSIGNHISQKRKEIGLTQQALAEQLGISFQAISKWETGATAPDILLLPKLASILNTTVDAIVGFNTPPQTHYEAKYRQTDFYWGIRPNHLCYEIMKLRPPIKLYHVLDIGCGEGKDAVFFAKNGYAVTAFDIAESGIQKAHDLALRNQVEICLMKSDVHDFRTNIMFDIIFSSGVFHYISRDKRKSVIDYLKANTNDNAIIAANVFVSKPFIEAAPDLEEREKSVEPWFSGELAYYFHDWYIHKSEEVVFDCNSGGTPHKHCMNILIAEKK